MDIESKTVEFTAEQFAATIKTIIRTGAGYSKAIGQALLAACYFSIQQKNASPANELLGALRKSTKQAAVLAILEERGNLAWMKSEKKPKFAYFDAQHVWMQDDVKELRAVCEQWEDYKPAAPEKVFDVQAAVEGILKTVASKTKNGKKVNHAGLAAGLKAALARYTAQNALETA